MREPLPLGVYVLTSSGLVPGRTHLDVARAAVRGGADAVQLRAPELADDALLEIARRIADLCAEEAVLFIVNDRVEIALASRADGVHLGQGDAPAGARDRLGREPVLGISVSSVEQAAAAEREGADYLGVTVWSTSTKPAAAPLGPEGLRAIVAATSLPVIGIGGVDPSNAVEVLEAGAAGVAVISCVGAAADPVEATRELVRVVHGRGDR